MRKPSFTTVMLILGLVFLYLPMLILVFYSFNASRLVTVWAGFSGRWYIELLRDQQILDAVWTSLRIAFFSASMAVCLGTLAAFVMVRFGRFRGKTALASMITAPLVMPEVITGLSLLLLFVHMAELIGWPGDRGMTTIWIAHTTFCSAYVAVVVSSRLREVDLSLEEAAMDLGAPPVKTFFQITLPVIAPALAAGWLLAFTLSLDDLVIASFVSGPGATTLPMVVFSSVRLGVSPKINALATLIILAVSLATFLAWYLMRRSEAKRRQAMQLAMQAA
ncbi:ABC transporter permease subunit [Halomonas heilongjiangensis]|uniref:Putrescine ABC transporter permease PotI n=1 Tax=Halomonas heilongjiangensis TaxID=1387883 RepID=A0A2N7TGD6_9GAMM|nr:ABC transporter permease subunit [Halomonas heilongjiangensis]PMR67246.1 putrescine ABC transporter permease PotI [Halomonas heilongjiangensis]PXX88513.1 putrescine ABC transporter permease PotI [Halomonas heilongjiangensis]